MSTDNNIWKLAEAYTSGGLNPSEVSELKQRLEREPEFASEFDESVNLLRSLNSNAATQNFRSAVKELHAARTAVVPARTISLKTYYWRTAAVAAGIAILTSLTTLWAIEHNNKKIASQYSLLRRDLEKYKRSQNELIRDIKDQKTTPEARVRYTGTGFALTNDGYLVTDNHVIDGADSVYIQNNEGKYFKADVIATDANADIAILKIADKKFRFGKTEVPYTFVANKRNLGTRVYTLGFPEDEIIYNEGYISARNGFDGDSMQYRLEIPSAPGQSGAPVVDARGNVVAIITGKETESQGTTYAVSSKALIQLVQSISDEVTLHLPKANKLGKLSAEQQTEKLEKYTCSVKVYKK